MQKKPLIIGISAVVLVAVLAWAFIASTQPPPGVEELQNDRTHIPEGSQTNYTFNPPTSGAHYPSWLTKGFYDEPRPDGNVVHSQEHGYIIFWYNCGAKLSDSFQLISEVYAQTSPNGSIAMTAGSQGSPSATLKDMPKSFSNGSCDSLKNQIKEAFDKNGDHKLIAMPRPNMGNPLTLTAWGRAEKLNTVDQNEIKAFIDAFRDNGPEQTNEP